MSVMQNHQVNVLVVDPDPEFRGLVHDLIVSDGYTCTAVSTASSAMEAASHTAPNLLICDMNLSEDSGLELFVAVKEFTKDCPVLFISDSRRPETLQHARLAGATYFLSKPIDPTVLIELVDKALWMPHLVRRHIDSVAHRLRAPSIASKTVTRIGTVQHLGD